MPHSSLSSRPLRSLGLALAVGASLSAALACQTSPATPKPGAGTGATGTGGNASSVGGGSTGGSEPGEFGPGGDCDIQALMALPENGCTNAGCHGERFQGNLDLLSASVGARLLGVQSQSDACGGELLVDPENLDNQ